MKTSTVIFVLCLFVSFLSTSQAQIARLYSNDAVISSAGSVSGTARNGNALVMGKTDKFVSRVAFNGLVGAVGFFKWQQSFNGSTWYDISESSASTITGASTVLTYSNTSFLYPYLRGTLLSSSGTVTVLDAKVSAKGQ